MVLNIADMRLVHAREALQQLQERFGSRVFDTVIRRSVRYAESAERGVSILDYAPDLGATTSRSPTRCWRGSTASTALDPRHAPGLGADPGAGRRDAGAPRSVFEEARERLQRLARARAGMDELLFRPATELAR